jgi:muramoyltetrapeptide carboxypeptidase
MQMKYAGKFDGVRGIVFGEMLDCVQPGGQSYTLEEVILRVLADLKVPVAIGLSSGHVRSGNITLPFGVRARLQAGSDSATLTILESAVCATSPVSI